MSHAGAIPSPAPTGGAAGFERVRDAFTSNFTDGDDVGAAVAVWVEGELVVNLWGGFADAAGLRPWRRDTLTSVYSGSKGLTSTCVHLLADRGQVDLHAPVGALLAGVRPGGQAGHHRRDGAGASVRRHRTAHSAALGPRRRLGRGVRPH